MSSRVAKLKLGAILASTVASSYAVFGHDAWAPYIVELTANLSGGYGTSAPAVYIDSAAPTRVVKWPTTFVVSSVAAGTPCWSADLPAGVRTDWVIERIGPYASCTQWITQGAQLTGSLSGIGSTAPATTLKTGEATTVVRFPSTWTYDTTLAPETYCTPYGAPAGSAVGSIIVRSGNYAKCLFY